MVRKYVQALKRALETCARARSYGSPGATFNTFVPTGVSIRDTKYLRTDANCSNQGNTPVDIPPTEISNAVASDSKVLDKLFRTLGTREDNNNNKITVVGVNGFGIATVFSLLAKGITNQISMIDINDAKLQGELMDLQHGSMFLNNAKVLASKDYAVSANSKICIITAGTGQEADELYIDVVQRNAEIVGAIVPQLMKYSPDAILLIASDPVDALSCLTWKISGLPKNRVLGSGTNLDTARFRYLLSEKMCISPSSCHGYIIGENGTRSVPVWSSVNVAGVRLQDLNPQIGTDIDPENWQDIHKQVINSRQQINNLKGPDCWASALSLTDICHAILSDTGCVRPVSTFVKGEHNIRDEVFLSLPCVLGSNGVTDIVQQQLSETESGLLIKSAEAVAETQDSIRIVQ